MSPKQATSTIFAVFLVNGDLSSNEVLEYFLHQVHKGHCDSNLKDFRHMTPCNLVANYVFSSNSCYFPWWNPLHILINV